MNRYGLKIVVMDINDKKKIFPQNNDDVMYFMGSSSNVYDHSRLMQMIIT